MRKNINLASLFQNEGSLRNYCKELKNHKPLSHKEQIELIVKAKQGDQKSLNKVIEANLRFVVLVAKDYLNRGIPAEDLIGEGNIGLIDAIHRFDETKGFKFTTYAVWWIKQAMLKIINQEENNIRLPVNKINLLKKIENTKDRLRQKLEREPSSYEIINEIPELTEEDYDVFTISRSSEISYDQPMHHDDDMSYMDILSSGEEFDGEKNMMMPEIRKRIKKALSCLDSNERDVVEYFCGLKEEFGPLSFSEISKETGISSDRVRRIFRKAIENLRTTRQGLELAVFYY